MKKIVIIGGSRGIGNAILQQQLEKHLVYNISRTIPDFSHPNLIHFSVDVLQDELPDIEIIDALVYCPGSINLKPILSLSIDDFRNDFEINVIGAVKVIQHFLPALKKGKNPSIVLFSTVAAKLGMPFHSSIAASKSGVEGSLNH
ncbi:NAD(P)-dependent dehydrogenase (short-subunit alcohol dehydrogenase family) [Flavobacterium sp. SORGH_AS 622]|nr:NAD(P)-dependent dehydrogenase (short-subunit alcohol dehydrogenase family) [Flavobacterium sp. SORGH_AS_0622]